MAWGFPRFDVSIITGQQMKPHPVYNTRTDRIGSRFWRGSFARRRCLVPLNAWAEPEGEFGAKTRTWFSLPGEEVFAVAGIWQRSGEWGHAFSMMTVPAHEAMSDLNDRMPVVLRRGDWTIWTEGSPTSAHALCQPWHAELLREPTDEPWSTISKREKAPPSSPQLSLPL
jgi:putative SOS response-associated peptidase YedK